MAPLCILFAYYWPPAWCHGCSEVTTLCCPEGPWFKSPRTCYCPTFACSLWCLWVFSRYSGFLHSLKISEWGISEWTFGVSVNGFHADSAWALLYPTLTTLIHDVVRVGYKMDWLFTLLFYTSDKSYFSDFCLQVTNDDHHSRPSVFLLFFLVHILALVGAVAPAWLKGHH